jgi:hypothetical protein
MAAGHVLVTVVLALSIGLILNAADILDTAERQEPGWQRTVGVAVMEPIEAVTSFLRLDLPRRAIDAALDRESSPEPAGTPATTTTTTSAASTTAPVEIRKTPTVADPLRVFIGGDSMVGQFGPMLENRAEATGVATAEVVYEFDSGITRPDFVDWPAELRAVGASQDPEVIVLFFGGNDAQDIRIDGVWEPFGTEAWVVEYRSRVGGLMSELEADGRDVYWVGMPIVSSDTFRARVEILNDVYTSEAASHDNVHYVDSWSVFAGPDGGYAEYLPDEEGDVVDMRLNDGIHLTTDGGVLLAGVVWDQIAEEWTIE